MAASGGHGLGGRPAGGVCRVQCQKLGETNSEGSGYDVYRPDPYLLLTKTKDGWKGEIVWLPNFKHVYRVKSWSLFAKADITFEFKDGWMLKKITDKSDTTAIPAKVLDILASKIPAIPSRAEAPPTGRLQEEEVAFLFRLIYNPATGFFFRSEPIAILKVKVPMPAETSKNGTKAKRQKKRR